MQQSRKYLKIFSIIILGFAILTVMNIVSELWFGELKNAEIPEGAGENIIDITRIFVLSLTAILILPQVYVGIKGIKVANRPNSSRGHIIWATILLVFSAIGLISPIVEIFKMTAILENVSQLFGILVDVLLYFEYIKFAKAVSRGE